MRVAVATDHGGFVLKEVVIDTLKRLGHTPVDYGTNSEESVDYPDFVEKAGKAVANGEVERAVVICGSGVGVCIAGNKIKGVYACVCHDTYSAAQGVEHDHMNMLCLGGRVIGTDLAAVLVEAFITAKPSDEPRHMRRIGKVQVIEEKEMEGKQ